MIYSKEELSEYFYYDETSPSCLRWNKTIFTKGDRGKVNVKKGDVAGTWSESKPYNSAGSWNVSLKRNKMKVHRVIYTLFNNESLDSLDIDHINGNPKDNRIVNLRAVSHANNMKNIKRGSITQVGLVGYSFIKENTGLIMLAFVGLMIAGKREVDVFLKKCMVKKVFG